MKLFAFSLVAIFVLVLAPLVFAVGGGGGGSGGAPSVSPEPEPTEFVTISLLLHNVAGEPLANAEITVSSNKTYSQITQLTTGEDGSGSFTVGRYTGVYLVIRSPGIQQFVYPAFNASGNLSLVITPPGRQPRFVFNEEELKCWEPATLQERVYCRLGLEMHEPELYYVPEECRNLEETEQQKCFKWYDDFQKCRPFPLGQARDNCAKQKIGLGIVSEEKNACAGNATCLSGLRRKVFLFAKFKLYDLQDKAERWLKLRNASYSEVARFIGLIDQRKLEYVDAVTAAEKLVVLRNSKADYAAFLRRIKGG